ncbi:MAG TPA: hypothetical protein VFJ14_14055 [Nocardioidaceae bacterium]|nr:hypothetical protein [Nocardioidaceae bacterium]
MSQSFKDEQGELFPLLDAVTDPRPLDPPARIMLLDPAYDSVMRANGGTYWLTAGTEAALLWDATLDSFAHGIWAGTIVCAQAVCERTLASLIETWYAIHPQPKGWRMWGLGRLVAHFRDSNLADPNLLDQVQHVCDARKPFGHWRLPMDAGSLTKVGYDAYSAGGDCQEAQDVYVAKTAFLCAQTAVRVHFGDLLAAMPDRTGALDG